MNAVSFLCEMNLKKEKRTTLVIWFSRILRWSLGMLLLLLGYTYAKDDYTWVLIVFGVLLVITGFLRPKRCLDNNCEI